MGRRVRECVRVWVLGWVCTRVCEVVCAHYQFIHTLTRTHTRTHARTRTHRAKVDAEMHCRLQKALENGQVLRYRFRCVCARVCVCLWMSVCVLAIMYRETQRHACPNTRTYTRSRTYTHVCAWCCIRIDNIGETPSMKVYLYDTPNTSPLFRQQSDENIVAFQTDRYAESALIVKGGAAGTDLAASACFADLLRLARGFRGGE